MDVLAAVEAVARDSYGRLVAYLSARSRDAAGAEDALILFPLARYIDRNFANRSEGLF